METIIEEKAREININSDLWTDRQAAAYMQLKPTYGHITIQRWAREGKLRAGRRGRNWVFRKADLDDFIFPKR